MPPETGREDLDIKWGYLVFYDGNTCEFDQKALDQHEQLMHVSTREVDALELLNIRQALMD